MTTPIEAYKQFIDKLVAIHPGVLPRWIRGDGFPRTRENAAFNELLQTLSAPQREVLATMVQEARAEGIHDTLVVLDAYRLATHDGVALPVTPFMESLHYDFVSRREGDDWPEAVENE